MSTVFGFLWIDEEQLGFDPTITTEASRRIIKIQRNGKIERLVLEKLMKRAPCISGWATTCWKVYREDDPRTPLVVKDSWQFTEREEEGELLREATANGVVNIARYYHYETVHVRSQADEIRTNVRGDLNITDASNYCLERFALPPNADAMGIRKGRSTGVAGVKRSSS